MQRNFILTDVMKTGDHISYEQFINTHSMTNQTFDLTGEYYTLHKYDLESYDRRFALVDMQIHNDRLVGNRAYEQDLMGRLELLHQQGFVFVKACPWESQENISTQTFMAGKSMPQIDIPYPHITWTGGVSWFWSYMYHKHKNKPPFVSHDHNGSYWHKLHDFLYLNKATRKHRVKLYDRLIQEQVLGNSLYTFIDLKEPRCLPDKYELPGVDPQQYPRWGKDQDIYGLPYADTVCSIVSETDDNDQEIFMTEKIWKPIMAEHVFVVHGNHLYLQKLREMGFRTFGNYFDESYDLERDPDKRIEKLVSLCKDLKSKCGDSDRQVDKGNKAWQDIYLQTQSLRKHNLETFFNEEKLSVQVNKTLELFLEFADSGQVTS